MGDSPSSSDYLQVKKRKLTSLNLPNKNSSTHTENKQFKTLYSHDDIHSTRFSIELPDLFHREKYSNRPQNKYTLKDFDDNHTTNIIVQYENQVYQTLVEDYSIIILDRYNALFISGKYEELVAELTEDHVNTLVTNIKKILTSNEVRHTSDRHVFAKILKTYLTNLNIIVNYLRVNGMYNNTMIQLKHLQDSTAELLSNKKKLLQYIQEMSTPDIISTMIASPLLVVREEYVHYHNMYGVPVNLNYDLDKLNDIKTRISENPKCFS